MNNSALFQMLMSRGDLGAPGIKSEAPATPVAAPSSPATGSPLFSALTAQNTGQVTTQEALQKALMDKFKLGAPTQPTPAPRPS